MIHKIITFLYICSAFFLICCNNIDSSSTEENSNIDNIEYFSIEGLWIATPETSRKFPNGINKPALRISRDSVANLIAQGLFLWNNDYTRDWIFKEFNYEDPKFISWIDEDGDNYRGKVNNSFSEITGAVYLSDSISIDTLNFVRADKKLETRLFYPVPPENNVNNNWKYYQPSEGSDGLKTGKISDYNIDTTALHEFMNKVIQQDYGRIESILLVKNDELIVEEYFYGFDKDELHKIFSCSKSVVSLLLGISISNNEVNINQSVFDFFPDYDSLRTKEKEKITIKHLLTMTSGLDWIMDRNPFTETGIVYHDILSLPLESPPGLKFVYSDGSTDIIGGIIEQLEGKSLNVFARDDLFESLEIEDYKWEKYEDGSMKCGSGLQLYPRDMAKIGLLVLNDGKWNDQQVVEKYWIKESTKPWMKKSEHFHYGYQWWNHSDLDNPWWIPNEEDITIGHNIILAVGWGGQYIIIQKEQNLVCVITASNFNSDEKAFNEIPMVIEDLFPLFIN